MNNSGQDTQATKPTVIAALRRFLSAFLRTEPVLSKVQKRAVWAIIHCRTETLGGSVHGCDDCNERHYAYHSCNNKACPQCGRAATMEWVERQQEKRINAPYFMVTFTIPDEHRPLFFGENSKAAYDAFFAAASAALREKLADKKNLGAATSGFSMILHTWNQQMLFHPHIHCIVPGAGLDEQGNYVQVKKEDYLIHIEALAAAFRHHFGAQMQLHGWQSDPAVWQKKWKVNVQPFGDGDNAIKYLGRYISRSVIGDSRLVSITDTHVTFRYKDRGKGKAQDRAKAPIERITTLEGTEFVRRYLRHVLPDKLRGIRHYGFCHSAAKENRQHIKEQSELRNPTPRPPQRTSSEPPQEQEKEAPAPKVKGYPCPCCNKPMRWLHTLPNQWTPKGWLPGLPSALGSREQLKSKHPRPPS